MVLGDANSDCGGEGEIMNPRPVVAGMAYHQPDLFRFAMDEARRLGCGVRATHVNTTTELQDLRGCEEELFDKLRATAAGEPNPPPVDYLWWWGDPAEVLITESREAREVVIGVDEGTWLSKVAGGEVARKVALNAACPVVVYPTGGPSDGRRGRVVVAVDTSEPVDAPLQYAFEAARRRHESIHVVEGSGMASDYPERERRRNRLGDIVDLWRVRYPDVPVQVSVEGGPVVAACILAALDASLLVLGRPRNHHATTSFDAVAARVLRRAHAPVAVIPGERASAEPVALSFEDPHWTPVHTPR
jgi:nucleotide-binding universal stress UspA family protein